MDDEDAFVRSIELDPYSATKRMAYSDWLREQGRETDINIVDDPALIYPLYRIVTNGLEFRVEELVPFSLIERRLGCGQSRWVDRVGSNPFRVGFDHSQAMQYVRVLKLKHREKNAPFVPIRETK